MKQIISLSPHVHGGDSVQKNMYGVCIALVPALIASLYFFGLGSAIVLATSVAACVFFEWAITRFILGRERLTICDGSASLTGLLLGVNLPSNLPIWIIIIGALAAIGIGKLTFGGLGCNPFNPALVGRVFLLISFPVQMTTWPKPDFNGEFFSIASTPTTDITTGATPLGLFKEGGLEAVPDIWQYFIGHMGGSLGEVSALAILIGAIYLLCRRIISWHIPVTFIGTAFIFSGILWLCDKTAFLDPVTTILTGGIMLGACFMATDMVTSPMTKAGQLIFGFGCGLLTIIIRNWGNYPEGVSFAILLMNAVTPLLNRWFKPKRFAV